MCRAQRSSETAVHLFQSLELSKGTTEAWRQQKSGHFTASANIILLVHLRADTKQHLSPHMVERGLRCLSDLSSRVGNVVYFSLPHPCLK